MTSVFSAEEVNTGDVMNIEEKNASDAEEDSENEDPDEKAQESVEQEFDDDDVQVMPTSSGYGIRLRWYSVSAAELQSVRSVSFVQLAEPSAVTVEGSAPTQPVKNMQEVAPTACPKQVFDPSHTSAWTSDGYLMVV